MTRRFVRISALAVLAGLAPLAAHAQHASEKHEAAPAHADAPSAAPHAASEAAHGAPVATKAPAAAAHGADAKAAPSAAAKEAPAVGRAAAAAPTPAGGGNNLKAALERISQQIAASHDARESPRRSAAAAPRAAEPTRITLVWRPAVTWPAEVGGDGDPATPPPSDSDHVTLIWAEH